MDIPYLTHLMFHSKFPIDYNDHQMQEFDKNILTCGRWVGYRLKHHKMTNDEFFNMFKHVPLIQRDIVITKLTEK